MTNTKKPKPIAGPMDETALISAVATLSAQVQSLSTMVRLMSEDLRQLRDLMPMGEPESEEPSEESEDAFRKNLHRGYWRYIHRACRETFGLDDYAQRLNVSRDVVRRPDVPRGRQVDVERLYVTIQAREHSIDEDDIENLFEKRSVIRPMSLPERLDHQGAGFNGC